MYNDIYNMNMSISFLMQSIRVLNVGEYTEEDLNMVYNFFIAVDDEILNDYHNTCTILSYDSDLDLYIEIVDALIKIFEEREEYEKCELLKNKKEESLSIMQNKKI